MSGGWNKYSFGGFSQPATRYYASYDDEEDGRYDQDRPYRYVKTRRVVQDRPVGLAACCSFSGPQFWWTLLIALLLLGIIGGVVGGLYAAGKEKNSTNSTTTTRLNEVTQVSGPAAGSNASPAGPGMTTASGPAAGSNASPAGPGMTTASGPAAGSNASPAGPRMTTASGPAAGSNASPAGPGMTTASGPAASSAVPAVTTSAAASTTRPPIPSCPTSPVTIYQRVDSSSQEFNKSYAEMKSGFGALSGNYWRGLDDINAMTISGQFKANVTFEVSTTGAVYLVTYSQFIVGAESSGYQLTISGFSGNSTYDGFQQYSGYKFTTYDKKNDLSPTGTNCAAELGGAYWYMDTCSCGACFTQDNFAWSLGFSSTPLSRASIMLVCK